MIFVYLIWFCNKVLKLFVIFGSIVVKVNDFEDVNYIVRIMLKIVFVFKVFLIVLLEG